MHRIFQVANSQKINPKVLEDEEDLESPLIEKKSTRPTIDAIIVPAPKGDQSSAVDVVVARPYLQPSSMHRRDLLT